MTYQELVNELNSRVYTVKFREACQSSNPPLRPHEYIEAVLQQASRPIEKGPNTATEFSSLSQEELVDEVFRLGEIPQCFGYLATDKQRELVITIRKQWRDKIMTPEARAFAERVLVKMKEVERRL